MYRNTRLRVAAALAAITCLLFSQWVMAAYACPALSHAAAAAMASAAMAGSDTNDSDDSGNGPCSEHDADQQGLCLAHCNPTDLSLSHAQVDTPPVMLVALHPLADQREQAIVIATAPQLELPLRNHAPPFSILHCCFRI